jgi:electron transfer flavoprotein alpha subunit
MSILIYAESAEGKFKKVAFELASYAKKVAETLGTTVTALTVNISDVSELSKYGVDKVLKGLRRCTKTSSRKRRYKSSFTFFYNR